VKPCRPIRSTTRGTETSKYPQEEKIIMIPGVVASETGKAQTAALGASGL
jgi:hypothetical protein